MRETNGQKLESSRMLYSNNTGFEIVKLDMCRSIKLGREGEGEGYQHKKLGKYLKRAWEILLVLHISK